VNNEVVKIAEKRLIEEKMAILHTVAQKEELSSTGEVTKTGGEGLAFDIIKKVDTIAI
jgi:hypothetical protein